MKKTNQFVAATLLLLSIVMTIIAQVPASKPATGQDAKLQDEKVRITTNLAQVDVTVTDKDGRQVTDLRPEEFELTEDGKRQTITNFSYILNPSATLSSSATIQPASAEASASKSADNSSVPPARLRPEQVRRTIAFLVDDLGVSFESMAFVRRALREFVDKQMQPGDLVVILHTSGSDALQQFTTDKRFLYAAIDRIRWLPRGRGDVSAFGNISPTNNQQTDVLTREYIQDMQAFRAESMAIGTIGTLNLVLRSLVDKPGRKSVMLFSENFRILDYNKQRSERLMGEMKKLADYSNRASAVVYTIDTSGVQTLNTTSAESPTGAVVIPEPGPNGTAGPPPPGTRAAAAAGQGNRSIESGLRALGELGDSARVTYFESQGVLKYLADLTGGLNIRNNNNLTDGVERILEDQRGYYLIGYRPEESTLDPQTGQRRALKINLKVKRPGLRVRTRSSFYGLTDEERTAARRTRDEQLQAALSSPFAGDVRVRLTSLFADDQGVNSFVRAMVYVDARDLTFSEEPGGSRKAALDIMVMTIDNSGRLVDQSSRTETITAKGDSYKRVLQQGITYTLNMPVKQSGGYQVRIAVRDAASEEVGSASQFVEVPDLTKGGLTLSGIILSGISMKAAMENVKEDLDPQAGPAVRRLKQGMVLDYGYIIYNAQLDKSTSKPQVTMQMALFRDGKSIFTGRVTPVDLAGQSDMKRLVAGGRLQVGTEMTPGDYALQVIVTDMIVKEKSKDKQRAAIQWIDFEVVK
jgi:VWFA-related protein